ncbi:MAG: sugar ABC transporter permease [Fimbriimonas sp.]|nr:sugar ABC transporter permease [Fimbriimonas sp.]
MTGSRRREPLVAAAFLMPYLILFAVFVLTPVAYGFWISLHNWHILSAQAPFVGVKNYLGVVRDDRFWRSLMQTGYFVLLTVPAGNLLSLLMAVGLNQRIRGEAVYKVCFYMPVVTSVSVLAVTWRWLYARDIGILNYYLGVPVDWLNDPKLVMPSLAMMSIWWGAGGNMLIYLAALKAIPKEQLEAASLDGANSSQRFLKVSVPSITPAVLFCTVMSVIGASQVFGQSYILTGGGPADRSLTVSLYMYQMGFGQYQLGYACAVAYLLFFFVFAFSAIQFRLMARAFVGSS